MLGVGVELWWCGVMGGRRGAGKWTGGVASARAVHRRMSAVRKVRGWAAPAAGVWAVRAVGCRMPFCLKRFFQYIFYIVLYCVTMSYYDCHTNKHHSPATNRLTVRGFARTVLVNVRFSARRGRLNMI